MAQTVMSVRVDKDLKANFDALCDNFGLSTPAAITIFMKAVIRERKIPFEIKANSVAEAMKNGKEALKEMRTQAEKAGLQDMTLEEINQVINEYRNEQD